MLCPITLDRFRDPVVAADGHTYERAAIERWVRAAKEVERWPLSPVTLQHLRSTRLLPNFAMRKAVAELAPNASYPRSEACLNQAHHPLLLRPRDATTLPRRFVNEDEPGQESREQPSLRMIHTILICCVALPVIALLLAENVFFSLSMGFSIAETVARALADCGGALGAPLLFTGVGLCAAGVYVRDERVALLLVVAGAPLAIASFCHGLAAAKGGDSTSALFLSRCLLLAGFLFCSIGLHLAGRPAPPPRDTHVLSADPLSASWSRLRFMTS